MSTPDGYSTMTQHFSIDTLAVFIKHLAESICTRSYSNQDTPFQIFQILCSNRCEDSDAESDCSGLRTESEGDLTCRLYLARHSDSSSDSETSDISETSDVSLTSSVINEAIDEMNDSFFEINKIDVSTFDQCQNADGFTETEVVSASYNFHNNKTYSQMSADDNNSNRMSAVHDNTFQ
jgi:hypothetical protein